MSDWQYASTGSGIGLAPNRRQAITWTNVDSAHRGINAALGGDELTTVECFVYNTCWFQIIILSAVLTHNKRCHSLSLLNNSRHIKIMLAKPPQWSCKYMPWLRCTGKCVTQSEVNACHTHCSRTLQLAFIAMGKYLSMYIFKANGKYMYLIYFWNEKISIANRKCLLKRITIFCHINGSLKAFPSFIILWWLLLWYKIYIFFPVRRFIHSFVSLT